jgi:hypothetical protein
MTPIPINLAIEDELSEAALRRILGGIGRFAVGFAHRRGGFGYLRKTIDGWNRAARGTPFLVLTDLDQYVCPAALIADWLRVPKHPNLLFRVAVREVESWLLADPKNLSRFMLVPERAIPGNPDGLGDAKAALVELGRKSRSRLIRESIVPRRGSTAKQGMGYNGSLGEFIAKKWDFMEAGTNSPSLARTVKCLASFKPIWRKIN